MSVPKIDAAMVGMDYSHHMTVDPDETAARARALIESEILLRIDLVYALAQAKIALDHSVFVYDKAFGDARQAGWSADQLTELDLQPIGQPASEGRRAGRARHESVTPRAGDRGDRLIST